MDQKVGVLSSEVLKRVVLGIGICGALGLLYLLNQSQKNAKPKKRTDTKSIEPTVTKEAPVPAAIPPTAAIVEEPELEDENPAEQIDYESLDYPYDFPDTRRNIIYTTDNDGNKIIRGATVYKLIEKLTEESGKGTSQYTGSFLLTYRSFLTPRQLLQLLIKRYNVPTPASIVNTEEEDNFNKHYKKHIKLRVWYVLKFWIENHFYDFEEDKDLNTDFKSFISNTMVKDMQKLAEQLNNIFDKQTQKSGLTQMKLLQTVSLPVSILPKSLDGPLNILDLDPLEVARQLTLIEYEMYNKIQPKECLDQCWNKDGKETRAPHIVELIDRFNKRSRWVVTCVVTEEDTATRSKLITHFVAISKCCKELNNYNSMMGIVAGLMGAAVSRLKKSWQAVPKDVVAQFEGEFQVLFSKNFKLLRDWVRASEIPCLPYVGTYLADLTFIDDGNPNTIPKTKLINFEKRIMISRVISDLRIYQQKQYLLAPVPQIQQYLEGVFEKILGDNDCYKLSLVREPREKS
mmetsp:Transcript_68/g.79  ORF Transcript_68/g.79 Transcript_68/m.79 type:complete len:516 (-) Transcript_68:40-1587(-)